MTSLFAHLGPSGQMNPTNLTQLSPNFDPVGPTRPDLTQILILVAQPNPNVVVRFIKYVIALNPNLNPI